GAPAWPGGDMKWQTLASSPTLRPCRYRSSVPRNWLPTGPWPGAASTSSVALVCLATRRMVCTRCLLASADEDEAAAMVTPAAARTRTMATPRMAFLNMCSPFGSLAVESGNGTSPRWVGAAVGSSAAQPIRPGGWDDCLGGF